MFELLRKNNKIAVLACAAALAACDNPGRDYGSLEMSGTAGRAAHARGDRMNVSVASDETGTVAGASVFRRTSTRPNACPQPAASAANGCEGRMAGVYAIQTTLDVSWSDPANRAPAYDPGRGTVTTVLLGELRGSCAAEGDAAGELALRVCDVTLPAVHVQDDQGILQYFIPKAAWDSDAMPTYATRARVRSGGSKLALDDVRIRLGIEVGPIDTWPEYDATTTLSCAAGEGEACFPDQDADGQPGISLQVQPEDSELATGHAHYTPAPTDDGYLVVGTGATTLFAGFETTIGGSYDLESDCTEGSGAATAADFKLRAYDCTLVDGSPCTYREAGVVDRNLPMFHALEAGERTPDDDTPSAGPRSTLVRLGEAADAVRCSDARDVFAMR